MNEELMHLYDDHHQGAQCGANVSHGHKVGTIGFVDCVLCLKEFLRRLELNKQAAYRRIEEVEHEDR